MTTFTIADLFFDRKNCDGDLGRLNRIDTRWSRRRCAGDQQI